MFHKFFVPLHAKRVQTQTRDGIKRKPDSKKDQAEIER